MEPYSLGFFPDHLKTQQVCNKVVHIRPYTLEYVPDHLKTKEMCNEAMDIIPTAFFFLPDHFKTLEMCIKAVEVDPWQLDNVPDPFKTQKMCDAAVTNKQRQMTDIFSINVNKFVLSDIVLCNNGEDWWYIVGYQVDGEIFIPLFIRTPQDICIYCPPQHNIISTLPTQYHLMFLRH